MAANFSSEVIKAMGFSEINLAKPVVAAFHSLSVFSLQGLTFTDTVLPAIKSVVRGTPYSFAFGTSVNSIAQELIGLDLAEDEASWAKENSGAPPYTVVHVGPTSSYDRKAGYMKEETGKDGEISLVTFDAFADAQAELRMLENEVLTYLIPSLNTSFSTDDHLVRFLKLSRDVFGMTPENVVVKDIRIEVNATGTVQRRISPEDIEGRTRNATKLAAEIDPKAGRFFSLALEERDPLKKFLYFFLCVEIDTNVTFKSIDHKAHLRRIVSNEPRAQETSASFFEAQSDRWKTLMDRFTWCTLCAWTLVTDADVAEFRRLKLIRDDIAHGSIAEPFGEAVQAIEKLAIKLQRCRI